MIAPALLAALIRSCAPHVDVVTESAIVTVESRANPWAIADADTHRSYRPRSLADARATASSLLAAGHRVAVGLGQVLMPLHSSDVDELLDPCQNLALSERVLAADYAQQYRATSASTEGAHQQLALDRAFSEYNSGDPTVAPGYVRLIRAALSTPYVKRTVSANVRLSDAHVYRTRAVAHPEIVTTEFIGHSSSRGIELALPADPR